MQNALLDHDDLNIALPWNPSLDFHEIPRPIEEGEYCIAFYQTSYISGLSRHGRSVRSYLLRRGKAQLSVDKEIGNLPQPKRQLIEQSTCLSITSIVLLA